MDSLLNPSRRHWTCFSKVSNAAIKVSLKPDEEPTPLSSYPISLVSTHIKILSKVFWLETALPSFSHSEQTLFIRRQYSTEPPLTHSVTSHPQPLFRGLILKLLDLTKLDLTFQCLTQIWLWRVVPWLDGHCHCSSSQRFTLHRATKQGCYFPLIPTIKIQSLKISSV